MNIKIHNNYSLTKIQKRHLLQFGSTGFKIMTSIRLTESQIETFSWLIKKKIKNLTPKSNAKIWLLMYSNLVLTKLSVDARMGKGKGLFYSKAVFLKSGTIICEFSYLTPNDSMILLNYINKKFSVKLKKVSRFLY